MATATLTEQLHRRADHFLAFWAVVLAVVALPDTLLTYVGLRSPGFGEGNPLYTAMIDWLGPQVGLTVAFALAVAGSLVLVEAGAAAWRCYEPTQPFAGHVRHALYGLAVGANLFAANHNAALIGGLL